MYRLVLYGSFLIIFIYFYFAVNDHYSEPENLILENVPLECEPIYKNLSSAKKYEAWDLRANHAENELMNSDDLCPLLDKYFIFEKMPLSSEENHFPLAYGLVVYHDIIQVLLQLSLFYQPQNQFCITVDDSAEYSFKKVMMKLPKCLGNVKTFIGEVSGWGSFGIVENMYNCMDFLAKSDKDWKYFQYLSGSDIPIRTNLEMVRVMKALNGSINTDVEQVERNRLNHLRAEPSPLPLYKGSMSVALPREAANYIASSKKVKKLFEYLAKTTIPDESVWTTLGGNVKYLPVPGAFNAEDVLFVRHNQMTKGIDLHTVDHIGSTFIARYQVWWTQPGCRGIMRSASCVFGIGDVPTILTRPELIAHKIYRTYQPAALMCLMKEIRRRSYNPVAFDAKSYSEMPTVELHNGKSVDELTHPDWLRMSSFT